MDTTLAGLIGALLGALAGLGGTLIAHILQTRTARRTWLRDQKQLAYASAIRYMLRVINKRGKLAVSMPINTFVIKAGPENWDAYVEAASELFDDLSEVQVALTNLTIYAAEAQKVKIKSILSEVNESVSGFLGGTQLIKSKVSGKSFNEFFDETLDTKGEKSVPRKGKKELEIKVKSDEEVLKTVMKALDIVIECARQEIGLEIG